FLVVCYTVRIVLFFFFQAEDGIRDLIVTGVQTCALPILFGRKQEASDEGTEPLKHVRPPLPPVDGMFHQVTDVAWDSAGNAYIRSEERRVGKECRSRWWADHYRQCVERCVLVRVLSRLTY